MTMKNLLDFFEDPNPDMRIFFNFVSDSSPLRDGTKNYIYTIFQKVVNRFWMKFGGQVGCVKRTN